MKKTYTKQILTTAFAITLFLALSVTALAATKFQGSGTSEDPYLISTAEDLKELSETSNLNRTTRELQDYAEAWYRLTADIDMVGYEWQTIGEGSLHIFYGDFNGAGHTIYNLGNTTLNGLSRGLIGWLAGSVYDLNLSNVNFQGPTTGTEPGIGGYTLHQRSD